MDQLIQYGARVNNNIIQDKQCSHIKVPYGNTFQDRPWLYNPVITGFNKQHPISANIDAVEAKFVSSIDTTAVPGIRKTILLTTSANSRFLMSPARINYNIVQSQYMPTDEQFNKPNLPVAVLLEGEFPSAFSTRKPTAKAMERRRLGNGPYAERSIPTKQIVVSDGDMIRNYVDADGKIYPLGANNIERYIFGNKGFSDELYRIPDRQHRPDGNKGQGGQASSDRQGAGRSQPHAVAADQHRRTGIADLSVQRHLQLHPQP